METVKSKKVMSHAITELLESNTKQTFPDIITLPEVSSTNDYLLKLSQQSNNNSVCIASHQKEGRGRLGQKWISNADDICFSFLWHTEKALEKLTGISLIIGISVIRALEKLGVTDLSIKWPNDIFQNGKKLGGILVESTQQNNKTILIVGVGINITDDKTKQKLKNTYSCLNNSKPSTISNEQVIAEILNEIQKVMTEYETFGLPHFTNAWKSYDHYLGKTITVSTRQQEITGVNEGINETGELLLKANTGELVCIHSGKIQSQNTETI